jgi:MFS family permease
MTTSDQDAGAAPSAVSGAAAGPPIVSGRYALYAVILLTVINVVASIDQRVINVLAETIRNELHLRDWQIGMMSGLAFAMFYAALGFPIARLADRGNRPAVIVSSLVVWSAFTALSSRALNFTQLFLCRVGVGVGEAGCNPPSQSLIADYAPQPRRASSLAIWSSGVPLGALLGFALGGLVADRFGWRTAFLVAGTPGLVLALIAAFTLKETRSRLRADVAAAKANQPSLPELARVLRTKRTYWMLLLNTAVKMINTYGLQAFVVSFFMRAHTASVHHLAASVGLKSTGFLGVTVGLISGVCGAASIYLGGFIADRAAKKDIRNTMLAPAYGGLLAMPLTFVALYAHDVGLALGLLSVAYLLNGFGYGPVNSVMQGIVPSNMRAMSTSVALFLEILIGQAAGPVMVGLLSDFLASHFGSAGGLRLSLMCSSALAVPCAYLYLAARKTMREDLVS